MAGRYPDSMFKEVVYTSNNATFIPYTLKVMLQKLKVYIYQGKTVQVIGV